MRGEDYSRELDGRRRRGRKSRYWVLSLVLFGMAVTPSLAPQRRAPAPRLSRDVEMRPVRKEKRVVQHMPKSRKVPKADRKKWSMKKHHEALIDYIHGVNKNRKKRPDVVIRPSFSEEKIARLKEKRALLKKQKRAFKERKEAIKDAKEQWRQNLIEEYKKKGWWPLPHRTELTYREKLERMIKISRKNQMHFSIERPVPKYSGDPSLRTLLGAKKYLDRWEAKKAFIERAKDPRTGKIMERGPGGVNFTDMLHGPDEISHSQFMGMFDRNPGAPPAKSKAKYGGNVRYRKKKPSMIERCHDILENHDYSKVAGLSRIMYITHMPFYFQEKQMQAYFSQFGKVTRVKLARNLKTKQTKHFGFVEFESPELAYAVAEIHDTIIEGGKHLLCKALPLSEVHPNTMRVNRKALATDFQRRQFEKRANVSVERKKELALRRISRHEKRLYTLKELGVNFDYKPLARQAERAIPLTLRAAGRLSGAVAGTGSGSASSKAKAKQVRNTKEEAELELSADVDALARDAARALEQLKISGENELVLDDDDGEE